jgi:hypothetical protein
LCFGPVVAGPARKDISIAVRQSLAVVAVTVLTA